MYLHDNTVHCKFIYSIIFMIKVPTVLYQSSQASMNFFFFTEKHYVNYCETASCNVCIIFVQALQYILI